MNALENGLELTLDFTKIMQIDASVVPVVVQHAKTHEVLILAYANQETLTYTLTQGIAAFWSTSRNELWIKGATSGDTLKVIEVRVNCEQNSLLYLVEPTQSGVCHTRNEAGQTRETCFYRKVNSDQSLVVIA